MRAFVPQPATLSGFIPLIHARAATLSHELAAPVLSDAIDATTCCYFRCC